MYLISIILFIASIIVLFVIVFSIWILQNKKGTKLYNWINKHIITDSDLEI
jgi:hypothetical protein